MCADIVTLISHYYMETHEPSGDVTVIRIFYTHLKKIYRVNLFLTSFIQYTVYMLYCIMFSIIFGTLIKWYSTNTILYNELLQSQ